MMNRKLGVIGVSVLFALAMLAACGGGDEDGSTAAPSPENPAPPPDNVAGFVYATNQGNNVSAYTIDATTGALSEVAGSPFATRSFPFPLSVAVAPSGKIVYVTGGGSANNISAYNVDAATGALSEVAGSPFVAVGGAGEIAIHPTGKFAYVTGNEDGGEDGDVFTYAVNTATGALTRVGAGAFAGFVPLSVTVDPSGKFVYLASHVSGGVQGYTIDATTGALTRIGSFGTGLAPHSISVHPSGKFVYVATFFSDVWAYNVDAASGALSDVAGSPFVAGTVPVAVTVDPSGKFAYVANGNSNDVSAFTIDATTGALTSIGAAVAAGTNPRSITVDPSGKFVYVANLDGNNISAYTINATTGALTSIGAAVAAGIGPNAITTTRKIP